MKISEQYINDIAGTINEDGEAGTPSTPSQVVSQAIFHGFDLTSSIEDAKSRVIELALNLNLPNSLLEQALEYLVGKYEHFQGGDRVPEPSEIVNQVLEIMPQATSAEIALKIKDFTRQLAIQNNLGEDWVEDTSQQAIQYYMGDRHA